MQKDHLQLLKQQIEAAKHITIISHYNPDGDAVGSSLALYLYLKSIQKSVAVILPNDFPPYFNWLSHSEEIILFNSKQPEAIAAIEKCDTLFLLDFNKLHRVETMYSAIQNKEAFKVMIDHHQEPDTFPEFMYHDVKASSTCELVFEIINELTPGGLKNKDIAACIYTGIMTDTGNFKFNSVTPHTHRILAQLLETGISPHTINSNVHDSFSENRLKLLGFSISEKLTVLPNFATAYIWLTKKELLSYQVQKGDTEGIVNYPFSIKGILFCALFTEADGIIKMSFRSKGVFDVNQFSKQHFNGGGHINAAGGKDFSTNILQVVERFVNLLPEYKNNIINSNSKLT